MRLVVFLFVLGIAASAGAQDTECRTVRRGNESVVECSDTILHGRQQRPSVTIVLPRARNIYQPPPIERRPRREIVRSTRRL